MLGILAYLFVLIGFITVIMVLVICKRKSTRINLRKETLSPCDNREDQNDSDSMSDTTSMNEESSSEERPCDSIDDVISTFRVASSNGNSVDTEFPMQLHPIGSGTFPENYEGPMSHCQPSSPTLKTSRSTESVRSQLGSTLPRRKRRAVRLGENYARPTILCCCISLCLFSLITFLIVVSSLKRTSWILNKSVIDGKYVLSGASKTLSSLFLTKSSFDAVRNDFTWDAENVLCPIGNDTVYGSGMDKTSDLMAHQRDDVDAFINEDVVVVFRSFMKIQNWLEDIESGIIQANGYIWIIPCFLLIIFLGGAFILLVSVSEWKKGAPPWMVRFMPTVVMPIFIFIIVLCWFTAIGISFVMILNNDACSGGKFPGSPDGTALDILHERSIKPNSQIYNIVEGYTGGCISDPLQHLVSTDKFNSLVSSRELMWHLLIRLSTSHPGKECENSLQNSVEAAEIYVEILDAIINSIQEVKTLLSCERINEIYVKSAHKSLCTDMAYSISLFYLLLVVLSLCGTVIIALSGYILNVEKTQLQPETLSGGALEYKQYLDFIEKYK